MTKSSRQKTTKTIFLVIAAALLAAIPAFILIPPPKPAPTIDPPTKAVAHAALSPQTLIGLTRPQITARLGKPDHIGRMGGDDYSYYAGPETSFISIDSQWLVIEFQSDTATKAYLNTD